jgi:glycosyltransferase involved in cell wall biosynthesis
MNPRTSAPRVLLLTSSPLEGSAGADKQLAAVIAEGVPGVEFTWLTQWPARGRPRLNHGRGIPILTTDGVPHLSERLQITVATPALTRRTDLVHAVLTIGRGFPLFSRCQRFLLANRPVVHTVPGVIDPRYLAGTRSLGVTIALSEATAQTLRVAGFDDVRVVPPGIAIDKWPRRPRQTGPPTVLFAGHYDAGAGAREAVLAAAAAVRAGSRFRLALAMRVRPGQREEALRSEIAALASGAGLRDVHLYGHVPDMSRLLAAADVLMFTPRTLAGKADIPLIVLEALATGRPVILSDLPQFVALGHGVLRAPVGDSQRAGLLLAGVLNQPRWWDSLAEQGRLLVERRFGAARFTEQHHQIYRELLG